MTMALVTGTTERIRPVASALQAEGFEARAVEAATREDAGGMAPGSVGCYVQLTPAGEPEADGWGRSSGDPAATASLVRRLDTVAGVSAFLAPDAAVVVVTEENRWDAGYRRALGALTGAAVAERAGRGVRVAVLTTASPRDIAAAARREHDRARSASLADLSPDLGYADWREEVLSLTSGTEPTYFGWRGPDGRERAAVLRRAVFSPLTGAGGGPYQLARAVLGDALGVSGGAGAGDLERWVEELAPAFVDEVLSAAPSGDFEVGLGDVAAWVVRRSLAGDR